MTSTVSSGVLVAHAALQLKEINPKRSPAFSPNLAAWMRRNAHFYTDGGVRDTVWRVKKGDHRAAKHFGVGTLLIGAPYAQYEGDTDFGGTRLMAVLCQGVEATSYCWPGVAPDLEIVEGFWTRYLQVGRCAIDPGHQEHFIGEPRFRIDGDERTCLWCGAKHHRVMVARTVHDETWGSV